MYALEMARVMERQEVKDKIKACGLTAYGVYPELVSEQWDRALQQDSNVQVVAALNNSDTDGVLLELLKTEREKVLDGIAITGYALKTSEMFLYIPEYANDWKGELEEEAQKRGIEVKIGLVDVRKQKGSVFEHIVTAKKIADCVTDLYNEEIYLSVNGAGIQAFSKETELEEIISLENAKAIFAGYKYYLPEDVKGKTLTQLNIENGVLSVFKDDTCILRNVQERLQKSREISCGKCVFCREGLIQLEGMHKDITEGKGKPQYLELNEEIGSAMCKSGMCSMGKQAALPALTALRRFPTEYEEHIKKKLCRSGQCKAFENIYIDPMACTGCGECMDVCPKDCIEGRTGYIHMIDEFDCSKCGACVGVCEESAIVKTTGKLPKLPNRLTKAGKFKKH